MQPAPLDPSSPSRRRPRVPSTASSPTSSSSASAPAPSKRPRISSSSSISASISDLPTTTTMASAKARGKLPEAVVDLTKPPSAFQPHTGARKLVIKNIRTPGHGDARIREYYARTEGDLEAALEAIFANRAPGVPLERLYRGVEDMCRNGSAEKISRLLKERVDRHLMEVVLPRIQTGGFVSSLAVLRKVLDEWRTWNAQIILIRSTFSFLDRTYLLLKTQSSINDLAISRFCHMLFSMKHATGQEHIGLNSIHGICDLVDFDRRGDSQMDPALLKGSLMMIHVLGVYVKYLEPILLKLSATYFREFGEACSAMSLKDYISACEKLLQREHDRCMMYNLDSRTERQLMDSAHAILIDEYSDKLLHGESLSNLLTDKDVKSMKGLYDLLRMSGIQKKLKEPWSDYIRRTGSSIVSDKDRGDEMVLRLLELRRALDLMIHEAFDRDEDFLWGARESFGKFMNDREVASCWETGTSKMGEMTAKHIDTLLRGGIKSLPQELLSDAKGRAAAEKEGQASTADEDAELDRQLDQALELFRFIEGKDTFEAFYKKDLARRLLMGRSASQDAERNMLTKLRGECGSNFTHNLEQMFKDQELAKDEMEAYRQWCLSQQDGAGAGAEAGPNLDLHVMILSAAAWPSYPDVRLNLPGDVAAQIERFDRHYKSKHTGRTLTWKHSLAHCAVRAHFPRGQKELLVSAFQAAVLLLFNDVAGSEEGSSGFLAYEQISAATGLSGGDLDRTLQSLACGKARVLSKHPKGREVKPTDTFSFNGGFADAKYRVKINQIQMKESKAENRAINEKVEQDRRFETQAAIVRIMKSRQTMGHAELVAEVIDMTRKRGSVEPAAIKKAIENLIEKEYLERKEGSYAYVS